MVGAYERLYKTPEIAAILTNHDENAVADMRLLVNDHVAFASKYADWFEEMEFDSDWYALIAAYFIVGYETKYKYGAYIDWKEASEEIVWGLNDAALHLGYTLNLGEVAFDDSDFTDVALRKIHNFLLTKGYSLVNWDTESDCYHLFIVPTEKYDALVQLGKSMGIRLCSTTFE